MPTLTSSDNTQLYYKDWGSGPIVVFMHAWAMSSDMWQYQMNALAELGYRCIAGDRRGHGRSDDPGTGFDLDTLAGDLDALVEHLDLHDITLVAHSLGGGEAIRYVTRHGSGRVARIALVAATSPCLLRRPDNAMGVDASIFEALRDQWRTDFSRWIADGVDGYVGRGLPGCGVSEALIEAQVRDMHRASLRGVIQTNQSMVEADLRDELRKLAVPALVVHGDHDVSAPIEITGRRTAELIPDNRFIVYENAPHGLYLTHRDRLTQDLIDFIGVNQNPVGNGNP